MAKVLIASVVLILCALAMIGLLRLWVYIFLGE